MKTAESLANIYEIILKHLGPVEARKAVTTAVSNAMFEIQEEGLAVTPEIIESKLAKEANDYIHCDKKDHVA
jgi:hypothetical protein